ncbi:MAG TPA: hypothetical protein VJ809_14670, partial [Pirellulales bacterium]|nr:hypothetical protein [Pirellulales bacterium]
VRPLMAAVLVLVGYAQLHAFRSVPAWLPGWAPFAIAGLACCVSGVYAALTDTLSARIVRFLAQLAAIALIAIAALDVAGKLGAAAVKLVEVDTSNIAIVIHPGMQIRNGEGYATVSGFQKCSNDPIVKTDCIVVKKYTDTVQVQVHTREGNTYVNSVETWKVVRTPEHPDRLLMTRPNGEYVSQVQN